MRTTLSIDDDVLGAARELAARQHKSVGEVLSALARQALRREPLLAERSGVPLLPQQPEARLVTLEIVNQLRDALP